MVLIVDVNVCRSMDRGYVAVVNRSQKDIMDNMTVREGLTKENVSDPPPPPSPR